MNKILDFEWKWREKNTHTTPHGHINDEQCTSDFAKQTRLIDSLKNIL